MRWAISGSVAIAQRRDTGNGQRLLRKPLLTAGRARAICIAARPMDSGGTWAGATIASSLRVSVSPIEVEGVLTRHQSTRAAAVVEGLDEAGLSCVCAFVVLAEGSEPQQSESSLRELCAESLPRFKQPRRYLFVTELPTPTGRCSGPS